MLAEIVTWWAQQMRDVLPALGRAGPRFADAVVVRPDAAGLAVALRRRGRETPLGPLDASLRRLRGRAPGPLLLSLPAGSLLRQTVELPLAAERDLAAVLSHEMDRLTPFSAGAVYWAWRVLARDPQAGRLRLLLLLAPKHAVARSLAAMASTGLVPRALEFGSGQDAADYLPLTQPGVKRGGTLSIRLAAGACAALAAAALATPVLRQERAIATAERRIDDLRPRIVLVDRLRQQLAARNGGADLFATATARLGSPLRALAAITSALPDDTYLASFAMRERKMTMTGRSAGAVRLIGLLSADPDIRDPAFDAPVTRIADRSDLFSIRAVLAP